MSMIFRILFYIYTIVQLIFTNTAGIYEVIILLIVAAVDLYRYKFYDSVILIAIESVLIAYASTINPIFAILFGLMAYDFTEIKKYMATLLVFAAGLYLVDENRLIIHALVSALSIYIAYTRSELEAKEEIYKNGYDKERNFRYELEQTKEKLISSSRDIAHIAEIKERNRIAREIHDNVGHSIAGILMQLQAVQKLRGKDEQKSDEMLKNSIGALSDTLVMLRETVHNIKPKEKLGIEYIKSIVDSFIYCPVSLNYTGSFDMLPPNYMEILYTNVKEALTNASKYSKATMIDISIDVNEKFARLYIKDNGVGCSNVREGLGISGMKERIRNIGGSISISADNGFLIVCILPLTG